MHKRLFPKVNQFTYRVYYLAVPLAQLAQMKQLAVNRSGLIALREKDYGARDASALEPWCRQILAQAALEEPVKHIMLVTMPRIMGYGFNPVSFWLCMDEGGDIRAVLCEVHNTFGEAHSYLCAHEDGRVIGPDDWLVAQKLFHVSPFLPRDGSYRFRFADKAGQLGIWIDYCDASGNTQLLTSLVGALQPLTRRSLRRAFWSHPLVTLKTIALIHWQAVKLFAKGVRYIVKPQPLQERVSRTQADEKIMKQ